MVNKNHSHEIIVLGKISNAACDNGKQFKCNCIEMNCRQCPLYLLLHFAHTWICQILGCFSFFHSFGARQWWSDIKSPKICSNKYCEHCNPLLGSFLRSNKCSKSSFLNSRTNRNIFSRSFFRRILAKHTIFL